MHLIAGLVIAAAAWISLAGSVAADDRTQFLSELRASKLQGEMVGCIPETAEYSSMVRYSNWAVGTDQTILRLMAVDLIDVEPLFSYAEENEANTIRGVMFKISPAKLTAGMKKNGDILCLGTVDIQSIESYTTPADSDGLRVSNVTYAYRISGIPSGLSVARLAAVFPALTKYAGELKATARFVSTSDGWKLQTSRVTFSR